MFVNITGLLVSQEEQKFFADKIKLFTIENNNGAKIIVSNYGAAVISLFVKDRNGNLSDVVLGYEKTENYLIDEYYFGTVIGRYANRIFGDTVIIEGKPYKLSTREGGFHQHGGIMGFNKKYFQATPFKKDAESGIVFKYISPHLEEGFPGEL